MHITKIELENIKSHASAVFEFPRGTTAITGENGAGKTSIIEAVAWVLFDLLEYKKDDFLRRGATKGSARVHFISGVDEREYVVHRDTGTGYNVSDPRLGIRLADKKEEVFRFLWQHLGLEPGTDLKTLFRQAIGVPQGTFTAIFLEGATDRKIAFDRLLKVEEYRQAAEKLRETAKYIDNAVADARERIARAEGELSRAEAVTEEHEGYTRQITELSTTVERLGSELTERRERVVRLDEAERIARVRGTEQDATVRSDAIEAPGQLASHYAPGKPVRLGALSAAPDEFHIGFGTVSGEFNLSAAGDLVGRYRDPAVGARGRSRHGRQPVRE